MTNLVVNRILAGSGLIVPGRKPSANTRIDKRHHLARDLRFFLDPFAPNRGGVNLACETGVDSWDSGITLTGGRNLTFSANTDEIIVSRCDALEPDNITVIVRAKISDTSSGYTYLVSKEWSSFENPYYSYALRVRNDSGWDQLDFRIGNGSTQNAALTAADSVDPLFDKFGWYVGTFDGATIRCYLYDDNCALLASGSQALSGNIGYAATGFYIGESIHNDSHNQTFAKGLEAGDEISYIGIWGHAKTATEIAKIICDPYAHLVPANDRFFLYETAGAYSITCDPGSYAVTGTAATPQHDKKVSAETTSYAWTGSDATLTHTTPGAYTLVADAGSYTLTGSAATLTWSGTPPVPYDVGWKGGGRVMREGQFPEWWKEWEEPQPEVGPPKPTTEEKIAELASKSAMPKTLRKKATVTPLKKPKPKKPEPPKPEPPPPPPPAPKEVLELKGDIEVLMKRIGRMERKMAAVLLLLLKRMR